MPDALTIILLIMVALIIWIIVTYNRIIALRVRSTNAWSDIDVQLKQRWDLIPQLVETVKGYAAHEQNTLEGALQARSAAQQAESPARRGDAERGVHNSAARLFALSEDYPDLRADDLFVSLHNNLVAIEDDLESARRYYNAVVRDFNTAIEQFPAALIAGMMAARELEFFQLDNPEEALPPLISLSPD